MIATLQISVFVSILGLNTVLHAQAAVDPATLSQQTSRLVEILRPHVVELDRDLVTFHYENYDPNNAPTTLKQIQYKFLRARSFFVPEIDDRNFEGPGIYVATDPAGSRTFSDWTNPQLYVFTLKAGGRLLNLRGASSDAVTDIARDVAKILGCPEDANQKLYGLSSVSGYFRDNLNKTCARAMINAYTQLGIQGILYAYSSSNSLIGCRTDRAEAINVVSPDLIDPNSIALYSPTMRIDPASLAARVAGLYAEAARDPVHRAKSDNPSQFTAFPGGPVSEVLAPDAYRIWRDQSIYKCGPTWSLEKAGLRIPKLTRSRSAFTQIAQITYADIEAQDAVSELSKAISAKIDSERAPWRSFNVLRLNYIERLMYQISDFAADGSKFAPFLQAIDAYAGQIWLAPRAERLLEESGPRSDVGEAQARSLAIKSSQRPDRVARPALLAHFYANLGFGARLSLIATNISRVNDYAGVPILTGEALRDWAGFDAQISEANRRLYLSILKRCTAIYKNPDVRLSDISSGPCGVRKQSFEL